MLEFKGLYFLEDGVNSVNFSSTCLNSIQINNKVMLRHYRLDYLIFHYLKLLLPQLFMNKTSSFQCKFREMAKHKLPSFLHKTLGDLQG